MLEEHDTTESAAQESAAQESAAQESAPNPSAEGERTPDDQAGQRRQRQRRSASRPAGPPPVADLFSGAGEPPHAPPPVAEPAKAPATVAIFQVPQLPASEPQPVGDDAEDSTGQAAQPRRRNRNRRGKGGEAAPQGVEQRAEPEPTDSDQEPNAAPESADGDTEAEESAAARSDAAPASSTKKRRRRKRGSAADAGAGGDTGPDDPNTVTKVRAPRESEPPEKATGVKGSTRLEAKKQRRREGREAGRRRAPILSEAEFLARRESVDRSMVVRQLEDVTQIAVLEDGVLVEHYVTKETGAPATMVGNVYLGRVQNVLPSMEAAFVDIGRGRNAVLYAGEVNWDAAGLDGQPKRIEFALKSGDPVLVQVTKDPIGHKGARLTSQVSLPGRYLVFVPDGSMTGISRKLPDTERSRLRSILKRIVPEDAGVIVRTAAEGASEEELQRDVTRLAKAWEEIQRKARTASPPHLLHAEPDLAIRVVRDLFNEDFRSMQVSGDRAWKQVKQYVDNVAPDLSERLSKWTGSEDAFTHHRIDEQLAKALDRKVWLPSGGSLIIEHTEAMTVIDVNTGKFTGQGGDLEETVTQNNLEAAEEIVRQVRLRDIGGIIVIDFIDMVLESNRDLVLRRLVECLGRDRTKHQVTEITSLGLAQMTRKRIGAGLLETFSEPCEACNGRGVRIHFEPHGAPANSRRKPVKPVGAHDPVETMLRGAAESDAEGAEAASTLPASPEPEPRAESDRPAEPEPSAASQAGSELVAQEEPEVPAESAAHPGGAPVAAEPSQAVPSGETTQEQAGQQEGAAGPEQAGAAVEPMELVIAAFGTEGDGTGAGTADGTDAEHGGAARGDAHQGKAGDGDAHGEHGQAARGDAHGEHGQGAPGDAHGEVPALPADADVPGDAPPDGEEADAATAAAFGSDEPAASGSDEPEHRPV